MNRSATPEPAPGTKPTLMFIDDDADMLAALKRLFGYRHALRKSAVSKPVFGALWPVPIEG